jgi:hypothetical protein
MTSHNDFTDIIYELGSNINIKIGFLLYIWYIIINTDVFHESILYRIDPSCYCYDTFSVTNKGFFIVGLFLVIFYLLIDLLDKNEMI